VPSGAALGQPALEQVRAWFADEVVFAESANRPARLFRSAHEVSNEVGDVQAILDLLRAADLGLRGARVTPLSAEGQAKIRAALHRLAELDDEADVPDLSDLPPQVELLHHAPGQPRALPLEHESLGTQVWLALAGPVARTLRTGGVLLADELDASLHPRLCRLLVGLFQNPSTNRRNAQLIFNSHDPTLLGPTAAEASLGRDQIWLVDKGTDGATTITSLADFSPRKDDNIEDRYLQGRYGGVPVVAWDEIAAAVESIFDGTHANT
jgi:hypothetical protein